DTVAVTGQGANPGGETFVNGGHGVPWARSARGRHDTTSDKRPGSHRVGSAIQRREEVRARPMTEGIRPSEFASFRPQALRPFDTCSRKGTILGKDNYKEESGDGQGNRRIGLASRLASRQ